MVTTQLPIIDYEGKKYFFDERLKQIRNVSNPHDFQDLNDFEMKYFKESKFAEIRYVDRIIINDREFVIIPKIPMKDLIGGGKVFSRKEYRLFVNGIAQLQDESVVREEDRRTLLLFDKKDMIGCRIDDKKRIFCGKNPEKMGYL